jgi:hypothetical protein
MKSLKKSLHRKGKCERCGANTWCSLLYGVIKFSKVFSLLAAYRKGEQCEKGVRERDTREGRFASVFTFFSWILEKTKYFNNRSSKLRTFFYF